MKEREHPLALWSRFTADHITVIFLHDVKDNHSFRKYDFVDLSFSPNYHYDHSSTYRILVDPVFEIDTVFLHWMTVVSSFFFLGSAY